jgi:Tfp pilus assembly protein PilE
MTAVQPGPPHSPPEGRYGSDDRRFGADADARADRTLKIAAIVVGTLAAVALAVYSWTYVAGTKVSAQVVAFKVVSDQAVEIHLEVNKDAGTTAVCTVRSVDADQSEVGRKVVRISRHAKQVDTVVTLETTARGQTGELVGCDAAKNN